MSGASPVLVVTRLDDATADVVIGELGRRSVPVVRLDPGDFPETVRVAARADGARLTGEVRTETRDLALDTIRSVYWRRPRPCSAPDGLDGPDADWCAQQARHGLGGILAALPGAHYVNHPWRNRAAEYKPAQLTTAARCGLRVPPTLLTNDAERARRFLRDHGPAVYKPLYNGEYTTRDGRSLTVWVEEVEASELDAGVGHTMHLFQSRVDKIADIRLTAVGDRLFAVRIDGAPGLDWRRSYDDLAYSLVDPPPDVAKGVRDYLAAFGLTYGAFDFGLDAAGRWHWYECNPNGQFAWFPDAVTDRITAALADRLQYPDRDSR
ncbi:ATP-grasp ribosomal peptide maturase [Streptomyces sp. NPDC090114]|uniref:ATP-grasp ribosomal peptide maturase n=1 Tax=Streptomyces sp. NPDC090114 TaxID=3365950 RepID=UPI0037F7BACC